MHVPVEIGGESLGARGHARILREMRRIRRGNGRQARAARRPSARPRSSPRRSRRARRPRARDRRTGCRRGAFSTVTTVFAAACAIIASSRSRPIQILPSRSASGAWNSATSGLIAGSSTIGSSLPNGLSMTFQSGRCASTSEPMSPRSGMNGTPFSVAWNAAWSAGQVASLMRMPPDVTAAVKRGAGPNSPRLTAEVSIVSTQPAPIRRSACRLDAGSADQVQPPDAAPDQRPRRRHGHARDVARHRQHAAVGDGGKGFVEGASDHGGSVAQTSRERGVLPSPLWARGWRWGSALVNAGATT